MRWSSGPSGVSIKVPRPDDAQRLPFTEHLRELRQRLMHSVIATGVLFIIAFIFLIFRQAQGNNNQALSFGKSRARMFTGDHPAITFADVAGAKEAKEELEEVVEFLKERLA